MSKKLHFRIADTSGVYADTWNIKDKKSEVYLMPVNRGGEVKITLHKRGRCHVKALKLSRENDPIDAGWQRANTPEKTENFSLVLCIKMAYPTSQLVATPYYEDNGALDIQPAPLGCAVFLDVCYKKHSHKEISEVFGSNLLWHSFLEDLNETLFILRSVDTWLEATNDFSATTSSDAIIEFTHFQRPLNGSWLGMVFMRAKKVAYSPVDK